MFDCFIKIDGIEGESTDDKHTGWIEVLLYDTSISQKGSSTASSVGGASAERADFGTFNFTKELDKASPKLALACADGAGGDLPFEILEISFGKIEWSYVQQKRASGGAAGNIAAGWNLEKNCKV